MYLKNNYFLTIKVCCHGGFYHAVTSGSETRVKILRSAFFFLMAIRGQLRKRSACKSTSYIQSIVFTKTPSQTIPKEWSRHLFSPWNYVHSQCVCVCVCGCSPWMNVFSIQGSLRVSVVKVLLVSEGWRIQSSSISLIMSLISSLKVKREQVVNGILQS